MFNTLLKFIGLSGLWILVISCTDEPTNPQIDYSDILKTETNEVIILTYNDLNEKASLLSSRINEFSANKTQAHLDLIRQLWRDARKPWEQAEGFLFGPVDLQGIDPSIDSWPVNVIDLDAVLASNDPLTKDYLDGLEGTLKGFHTLEYLLFGINGNKTIQEFTDRQIEYLTACAHSLQGETNKLFTSWINGPNPYGEILKTAGDSSNQVYLSQKSALQELLDGIITIADEVGNGKINDPFVRNNLTLEESRFSANSKQDFADNIRSIQNIYFGSLNTSFNEQSLAGIVKIKDAALHVKTSDQIQLAITSILSIPGTFTEAISANRAAIQNAQDQVRQLQFILESEIKPLLDKL